VSKTHEQTGRTKVQKEYLAGRVSQGFTERFRQSIPRGFKFGDALETALEMWMSTPEDYRIQALTGKTGQSLVDLMNWLIDQRIEQGIAAGKLLAPPVPTAATPGQKPATKGSHRRSRPEHESE
jgi:hypothetical protein